MIKLEQLQPNAAVRSIFPDALAVVVNVQWFGSEALELTYETSADKVANELFYRHDEARLESVKGDDSHRVHYIRQPSGPEPDCGVRSVNYDFAELLARAQEPA